MQISPGIHTQIQQLTDRAIIDWQSFSIGLRESVTFLQPGQLSVVLNRVTGGDPSSILGSLDANGNVFLINPAGIVFGPSSAVNVGGLVASTLNLSNEDFLAGNYSFTQDGTELAAVVNQGTIKITDRGYAVLTGPTVINEGTIVARAGKVVLAAGERTTLNLDGRDLVHFTISDQIGEGTVLLAPGVMSERLSETFGVNPSLRANSLVRLEDGSVRMVNGSGTLVQNGMLFADGAAGVDAGSITLNSTDITLVGKDSVTSASGIGPDSDGGKVLVLSVMDGAKSARGFTDVQAGSLLAATGGDSGDGGFIEVSGDALNLHGDFDLSAVDGVAGSFLLDPTQVTIVNGSNSPSAVTNPLTLSTDTIIGYQWFSSGAPANLTLESTGDLTFDLALDGALNPVDYNSVPVPTVNFNGNITLRAGVGADVGDLEFRGVGNASQRVTYSFPGSLTLDADGVVSLGDGDFNISGPLTIGTTVNPVGSLDFGSSLVDAGGNILINTAGSVTSSTAAVNKTRFNIDPLVNQTGTFSLTAGGAVSLGDSEIFVDSNAIPVPEVFTLSAGGAVDLGSSTITIQDANGGADFLLETTGVDSDIDLGTSNITFDATANSTVNSTIRAAGGISSGAANANPGTSPTNLRLDGNTVIEALNGSIELHDVDLRVSGAGASSSSLNLIARNGGLNLGESRFETPNNVSFRSSGVLDTGSATIVVPNQVTLASATRIGADDGFINTGGISATDIDVLGISNLAAMTPGGAVPGAVGLELDILSGFSMDLSVLATGDVTINSVGGGNIVAEAAGPSAISSSGGSVFIATDGAFHSGTGTDVFAAETASITASAIGSGVAPANRVDIQGRSVILDGSAAPGSLINANILGGDTSFLSVSGNQSAVQVRDNATSNVLTSSQIASESSFDIGAMTIDNIFFSEANNVVLDDLAVAANQSVGIESRAGDISATGGPINLAGRLSLESGGNVGLPSDRIVVDGGTIAVSAGGNVNLEGTGTDLILDTVDIVDHTGASQNSVSGVTAAGDINITLSDSVNPTQLQQNEDIISTGGNVAIDLVNGSLVQASGKTIASPNGTLALRAAGTVGSFDGTVVEEEVNINAGSLVLDVGEDALLNHQGSNSLSLIDEVTIQGETFTTSGAGGDLRVLATQGGIALNTDLVVGGEAALVTGNNLVLGQGPLPGDIVLNGNLQAGDSLVVLSGGNIVYQSGTLQSPQVGLGAAGTIGSPSAPVVLQADQLTTAPFEANVFDADGFTVAPSVSAVGVTVNQAAPLPDPPPVPEPPVIPPTPNPVPEGALPPEVFLPPTDIEFDNVFAVNDTDFIEEFLEVSKEILLEEYLEEDPTRRPIHPDEDDFLRKKFRR